MTKIKLELISDIDMHLFIEKEMRGDICYISTRYSKTDKITQLCIEMQIICMVGQ